MSNTMGLLSLENAMKLLRNPSIAAKVPYLARRDAYRFGLNLNRSYYKQRYEFGSAHFMGEDWDNLFILDAARPEFLSDFVDDALSIGTKKSPASYSGGFIQATFSGSFYDTVYVTANPHIHDVPATVFYTVVNLLESAWSEDEQTVRPEDVVSAAVDANQRYPDKRLVVHFMQPHFPFLGPAGESIKATIEHGEDADSPEHPWNDQMFHKRYDRDTLTEAYRENHEIALSSVMELHGKIDGQTVITADHANLIGERGAPVPMRMYGHPIDFPHPNLTRVPWITLGGVRRDVCEDDPLSSVDVSDDVIEDRLAALGYA